MPPLRIALIAAGAVTLLAGHPGAAASLYNNDRFGFRVDVPDGFVALEAPANDDGRAFQTPDGAVQLAASATGNANEDSMLSYITVTLDRCRPGRPDYLSVHQDWAVMSCTMPDGRTLYAKTFMRGRGADAVFTSVRMTYPTEQRQRWDSVAVAATKSLIPAVPQ